MMKQLTTLRELNLLPSVKRLSNHKRALRAARMKIGELL